MSVARQPHKSIKHSKAPAAGNENTPPFQLSAIDSQSHFYPFAVLMIFPPPPPTSTLKNIYTHTALETSLSTALGIYPYITGRLTMHPETGAASIDHSNLGCIFIPANCDTRLSDHFPLGSEIDKKEGYNLASLPKNLRPSRTDFAAENPLLVVQCTIFACGALVIGADMHHSIMDGQGFFEFMDTWGRIHRGLEPLIPAEERSLLNAKPDDKISFDHVEYIYVPDAAFTPSGKEITAPPPPTSTILFDYPASTLAILKSACTPTATSESKTEPVPFISTMDALQAHLLACMTASRSFPYPPSDPPIRLNTTVNARKRLLPPLPARYAGNVVFNAQSSHLLSDLRSAASPNADTTALAKTASNIRTAISRTTDPAYLRSALAFVCDPTHAPPGAVRHGVKFWYGADVMLSSWVGLGSNNINFGGGGAVLCGADSQGLDGVIFVIEDGRGGSAGGIRVVVTLVVEDMERMKEVRSEALEALGAR